MIEFLESISHFNRRIGFWLLLLLAIIVGNSCNNIKYLSEDQALVTKNAIKFDSKLTIEKKNNLNYELKSIIQPKPNSKFLGAFRTRLWIHNRTGRDSTKKFKRWLHNRVGESPALYNENTAKQTAEDMQYYLNNKGYFNAIVTPDTEIKKKRANTTYKITTKPIYVIDEVDFQISDTAVKRITIKNHKNTLLRKGEPVEIKTFDSEKTRISNALRNEGYAYFYPDYINFKSFDSTNQKVDVTTYILPPNDTSVHLTYTIGDIYVLPNYYPTSTSLAPYDTMTVDDYTFLFREEFNVKTKLLVNSIYLKHGELFRQKNYDDTNKRLGGLGIYKFVSIRFFKNPEKPGILDFFIYLTPSKKNVLGFDFELNTANGNALGTGVSLNFRNRNFLKGAEVFSINVESGVEWAVNNPNFRGINTVDLGLQFGLILPKWVVPLKLKSNPKNAAQSIVNLEYNYQDRRIYYRNGIFSASFGYDWRPNFSKRHIINPVSINFIRINEIRDSFQVILDDNPFLQESFRDQFIMGANYSFIYTSPVAFNGDSWFFRGNAEVAGNTTSIFDALVNSDRTFQPFGNEYSQYLRLEGDIRYYKSVTRRSQLAARFYTGVGVAYGNSTELPYLKQYFAGGTTSMRAWILRELGPGAYIDTLLVNNPTVQPYQAAGFKLEANVEYRFDIFSAMEGALFVDAGNIWTLKEDARGPEAVLKSNFLDQLAIGAGFGVRFDFSYFVVRFDMAYKIRTPFLDEETGSHFYYKERPFRLFNGQDVSYNLAIGYPF